MGLLQKFKDWLTGDNKKSSQQSKAIKEANRTSYYGGGGSASVKKAVEASDSSSSYRKAVVKQKKKEEEKKQQIASAFKAVEKKAGQRTTPVDPKQKIQAKRHKSGRIYLMHSRQSKQSSTL